MSNEPEQAISAEIERVHPRYVCDGMPPGWLAVTAPEPCESCGTRVFAMQPDDLCGPPQVFHVGWVHSGDTKVRTVPHTRQLCRQVRDSGVPLEGRHPRRSAA